MATCWNCDDPVDQCKCGNTETYDDSEGPICPYCGKLNRACDSDGMLYDESLNEYECDGCEKTFTVGVSLSYSWTAKARRHDVAFD